MKNRYDVNRSIGSVDRAIALPMEARANDDMAQAAEWFFADRYGLKRPGSDGPTPYDFVVGMASIDVKWSPRGTRLIHAMSSPTRATVYVLVNGVLPIDFRLMGWAWGFELHRSIGTLPGRAEPTYMLNEGQYRENVDLMMAALCHLPVVEGMA